MKATIKTKGFLDKLGKVDRILSAMSSSERKFVVHTHGGAPWLSAYSDATFVQVSLASDISVNGEGRFGFDPPILSSLLARRAEVQVALVKNQLKFKTSGRDAGYSGEVVTIPVTEQVMETIVDRAKAIKDDGKQSGLSLTGEAFDILSEGVRCTFIAATHKSSDILTHVHCKGNVLSVGTTDKFHAALYKASPKVMVRDFHMAVLPTYFDHFEKIRGCFGENGSLTDSKTIKVSSKKVAKAEKEGKEKPQEHMTLAVVEGKRVSLSGKNFAVQLPSVQEGPELFDMIVRLEKSSRENAVIEMEVSHEKLLGSLDNLNAIYEYGSAIEVISVSKDGDGALLELRMRSDYGNITDKVGVKGRGAKLPTPLRIDPETFGDSLLRFDGDLQLKFSMEPRTYWIGTKRRFGTLTHTGILLSDSKEKK